MAAQQGFADGRDAQLIRDDDGDAFRYSEI